MFSQILQSLEKDAVKEKVDSKWSLIYQMKAAVENVSFPTFKIM